MSTLVRLRIDSHRRSLMRQWLQGLKLLISGAEQIILTLPNSSQVSLSEDLSEDLTVSMMIFKWDLFCLL